MLDFTCIENVIGLSKRVDDCLPETPGDWSDINESYSGYYLDSEYIAGTPKNYDWDKFEELRIEGLRKLMSHYQINAPKRLDSKFGSKSFIAGRKKNNSALPGLSESMVGIEIKLNYSKGTVLRINRVSITLDTSFNTDINLYCVDTGENEVIGSLAVGLHEIQTVELNYSKVLNGEKEFILWYDRQSGTPFNYDLKCGSCNNVLPWQGYAEIRGVEIDEDYNVTASSIYTNGMIIEMNVSCDLLSWVCKQDVSFWHSTPFGTLFATIAQLYGAIAVNEYLMPLESPIDKEKILAKNQGIKEILDDLVNNLLEKVPSGVSDCFTCKNPYNAKMKGNLLT